MNVLASKVFLQVKYHPAKKDNLVSGAALKEGQSAKITETNVRKCALKQLNLNQLFKSLLKLNIYIFIY
ncbi:hypothetical protein N665_1322s0012 [Sinapis alba]|nr:hypothetical protein N665_1322s0012 [Sinapis alba]